MGFVQTLLSTMENLSHHGELQSSPEGKVSFFFEPLNALQLKLLTTLAINTLIPQQGQKSRHLPFLFLGFV